MAPISIAFSCNGRYRRRYLLNKITFDILKNIASDLFTSQLTSSEFDIQWLNEFQNFQCVSNDQELADALNAMADTETILSELALMNIEDIVGPSLKPVSVFKNSNSHFLFLIVKKN